MAINSKTRSLPVTIRSGSIHLAVPSRSRRSATMSQSSERHWLWTHGKQSDKCIRYVVIQLSTTLCCSGLNAVRILVKYISGCFLKLLLDSLSSFYRHPRLSILPYLYPKQHFIWACLGSLLGNVTILFHLETQDQIITMFPHSYSSNSPSRPVNVIIRRGAWRWRWSRE